MSFRAERFRLGDLLFLHRALAGQRCALGVCDEQVPMVYLEHSGA